MELIKPLLVILLMFIAWPVLWIVAYLRRLIGRPIIRNEDGYLQTPVIVYRHQVTGKKLIFVSAVHVGNRSYYRELQEIIDKHQKLGYKILYERVSKITEDERSCLNQRELHVDSSIETLMRALEFIRKSMWLHPQRDGLTYDDATWINTDISGKDLVSRLAAAGAFREVIEFDLQTIVSTPAGRRFLRWLINFAFKNAETFLVLADMANAIMGSRRWETSIILGDRNKIGLEGIAYYGATENVVTIWGAAHHLGMSKALRAAGWKEVSRVWINAYRTRPYSLRRLVAAEFEQPRFES